MSSAHLEKGSKQPPKIDGKLRLYSMQFCPFAERVRLILLVKGVPHDIVNVHLKNKPEWIFDLHPEGKVPALDTGSELVIESLDIADYLDEKYPEPPLYSKDPQKRNEDKTLIKEFGNLIINYYTAAHNPQRPLEEHLQKMLPHVKKLENELQKRGVYFGGDKPSMVDYMLWPWGERAGIIGLAFGQKLPNETEFPRLYSWCKAMRTQPAVEQTVTSLERLYNIHCQYRDTPNAVNYDTV